MSLPLDMIVLPIPYEERKEFKRGQWLIKYKIDYPNCMQHKEYPRCLSCNQKYVPIDKEDVWCFKCRFTSK